MKSQIQRPNNKTQPSVVCELGCVSLVYVVWGRSSKNTIPELFNNSHIWTFCIGKVRRWTIPEEPDPLDRVRGRITQNTHLAEGVLAYEVHSLKKPTDFIHSDKSYLIFIIVFIATRSSLQGHTSPKNLHQNTPITEASHSDSNNSDDFP